MVNLSAYLNCLLFACRGLMANESFSKLGYKQERKEDDGTS